MPNLGPTELLILGLLLILFFGAIVTGLVLLVRRAARPATFLPHPANTSSSRGGADLASRVHDLKVSGRAEQAVLLVRGETGMTEPDARRFVDAIG
ncbi:hypothetical protein ACFY19_00025 [Streptosporangium saharense]|uniref:Ribosomal protein L7/L12 C-terminal domain-containing protein n=1 Tax=Streptosporangium saharense TaxID=1706840 RepID=A0A7W7QSW0_9ACTN|nr:hypothetical protein [Streptosporangium saharense]MBB4919131.1 hypothetical protein [Streptosporangium saharense]